MGLCFISLTIFLDNSKSSLLSTVQLMYVKSSECIKSKTLNLFFGFCMYRTTCSLSDDSLAFPHDSLNALKEKISTDIPCG